MGDSSRDAVEVLWREFAQPLRQYFRKRVAIEADVEDLVQEAFLRIHAALGQVRDTERYAAWIRRIARNVWVDSTRRRHTVEAGELDPAADEEDPDLSVEVAGWLESYIECLDAAHAEVLRRSELEGEKHRDIADDLGLSVSAVKSRVQRGREKIRRLLEDCCEFEFDHRGLVDWRRRSDDCGC